MSDCCCGLLDWTVQQWGRVTHKHSCPHRTDPWCQTHPTGCDRYAERWRRVPDEPDQPAPPPAGDAPSVWSDDLPPGGNVCSVCGWPTESEPCREHQPGAYAEQFAP